MFMYDFEKTAVFIDGANLHHTLSGLGQRMDFAKVYKFFHQHSVALKLYYYTGMLTDDGSNNPLIPIVDWLEYNGYTVRKKFAKSFRQEDGSVKIKGNMDIEMCVDIMRLLPVVEHFVLFTGDGDFCYLVDALQQAGKRVTVCSSIKKKPAICSDDLRRAVDQFIDLGGVFAENEWMKPARTAQREPTVIEPAAAPVETTAAPATVSDVAVVEPVSNLKTALFAGLHRS